MYLLKHMLPRFNGRKRTPTIAADNFRSISGKLQKSKRWREAAAACEKALSQSPDDIELWRCILEAPVEAGYAEPAARIFGKHFAGKSSHELEAYLHHLLARETPSGHLFLKAVSDFFWENGPIDHALAPSEVYLQQQRHIHLLFRAAEIHGLRGNDQRRSQYLEDVVRFAASSAVDWLIVGSSFRRLQRWDEAFEAYEQGLNIAPHDQHLWRAYAETAAVAKSVEAFVASVRKHRPDIAYILAEHPPHSAVYFLKYLKRAGEDATCDQVVALIIEDIAVQDLDAVIERAMAYITDSTTINAFDLRDQFRDGLIAQWGSREGAEYSKASFRLKLLRLFFAPRSL